MGLFDAKLFNGEVFQKYVDRVPNTKLNELIKSRAIAQRQDLVSAMSDQVGGNYITTPLKGLISGSTPVNYDGVTNITSNSTKTFKHSRVVVGRANAWTEKDFSYDITGGVDFMENVAQQVAEYWDEIDQNTLISIMKGVFSMNDLEGAKFVTKHTSDITSVQNSEGKTGYMDGTSLNTAIQKACGDHKNKFSLAIMHSVVATNLENLKILVYLKYNDANGMERDSALATLNGRLVMVDDSMPVTNVETTAGVYGATITTAASAGDKVTVNGITYTWIANGETPAAGEIALPSTNNAQNEASALASALNASTDTRLSGFTWSNSTGKLVATEDSGHYGEGPITVVATKGSGGTLVIGAVSTDTAPVISKQYTTYVFGDGAIEYTNCGAKVPAEMDRNPSVNGGEDTLYNRQRKCWAPYGISFTQAVMSTLSPNDEELENGANWELVNTGGVSPEYISDKAIAIARIISLG